jgi:hypothetical protein
MPGGAPVLCQDARMVELVELRIPTAALVFAEPVVARTDAMCAAHLDAEYADLARRLVGRLARKRPTPLARGDAAVWAAGVIYVLGQLNFLFDRSQQVHTTADELSRVTGVKKTTMANKARAIHSALKLEDFDSELLRREVVDGLPVAWLVEVDGFVADARQLPVELQVAAYERGLIPYVPAHGRANG